MQTEAVVVLTSLVPQRSCPVSSTARSTNKQGSKVDDGVSQRRVARETRTEGSVGPGTGFPGAPPSHILIRGPAGLPLVSCQTRLQVSSWDGGREDGRASFIQSVAKGQRARPVGRSSLPKRSFHVSILTSGRDKGDPLFDDLLPTPLPSQIAAKQRGRRVEGEGEDPGRSASTHAVSAQSTQRGVRSFGGEGPAGV